MVFVALEVNFIAVVGFIVVVIKDFVATYYFIVVVKDFFAVTVKYFVATDYFILINTFVMISKEDIAILLS